METERRVRWLRRLGVILTVWTFALMGLGAWVKATGSGLACPDWPQCYGQWFPPFPSMENGGTDLEGQPVEYTQAQVLYEWAHRAVASLLGIPFLLFVFVAWRGRELHPAVRGLPVAAGVILFAQVLLGGGTVLQGNPAYLTTTHMLTATLFFACVLLATAFVHLRPLAYMAPAAVRPAPTGAVAPPAPPAPARRPASAHPAYTAPTAPSPAAVVRHPGEPEA